jgi:hypothetical protein
MKKKVYAICGTISILACTSNYSTEVNSDRALVVGKQNRDMPPSLEAQAPEVQESEVPDQWAKARKKAGKDRNWAEDQTRRPTQANQTRDSKRSEG